MGTSKSSMFIIFSSIDHAFGVSSSMETTTYIHFVMDLATIAHDLVECLGRGRDRTKPKVVSSLVSSGTYVFCLTNYQVHILIIYSLLMSIHY